MSTEFRMYENPGPNSNWWTLGYISFLPKSIVYTYLFTKKEYITVQLTSRLQHRGSN